LIKVLYGFVTTHLGTSYFLAQIKAVFRLNKLRGLIVVATTKGK
jgi:hypothetical protein